MALSMMLKMADSIPVQAASKEMELVAYTGTSFFMWNGKQQGEKEMEDIKTTKGMIVWRSNKQNDSMLE